MDTSPTLYHHSLKLDPIALDISDQENTGIIFKIFFYSLFLPSLLGTPCICIVQLLMYWEIPSCRVHWPDGRGCFSWDGMLLGAGSKWRGRGGKGVVGSQVSEQPV